MNRLLVIGWDGADWAQVHPLLDAGKLPTLLRLVEAGSAGALAGLAPATQPVVWTSLATGRHAEHHRVLGEYETRPDGGGVQSIGRRSWRAPAFWELLAAAGLKTAIVNWPATSPATLWPGIVVDDNFAIPAAPDFDTWPLAPRSVSPESWCEVMTDLRVHPREIGLPEIVGLVPRAAEIDQRRDRRLARLALSLAKTAGVHAAATHLAETAPWDLLAVRYSLLADAPRDIAPKGEPGPDESVYAGVMESVYRFHDAMLARLLALAGPDTRVILVAPYTRPAATAPRDNPMPTERRQGMMLAAGPGFVPDAILQGAGVLDLAPTILASFGLAAETDGHALTRLFADAPALRAIALPPPQAATRPDPAAALLAQGYAENFSAAETAAIADTDIGAAMNLADSFLARGEWKKAAAGFESVLIRRPDDYGANVRLCHALLQTRDAENARPVAETVLAMAPDLPWGDLLLGIVLVLEGDAPRASAHLDRARERGHHLETIALRIGWVNLLLRRPLEAEAAFRDALAADANLAEAHTGLGVCLEALDRTNDAEAALRRAIALEFHNAIAHLHLGRVLAKRGDHLEAVKVLRIALAQSPHSDEVKALLAAAERNLTAALLANAKTSFPP